VLAVCASRSVENEHQNGHWTCHFVVALAAGEGVLSGFQENEEKEGEKLLSEDRL
jgi:hypothetical protein